MYTPSEWIDPRLLDFSDSFNPLAKPGFRPNNNRFVFESWNEPIWQAIRQAEGLEPRIWVCPDSTNQIVAPFQTIDFNVPCEPNTWILGLNCASNPSAEPDAASFYVQVIDSITGATLFSQPVLAKDYYPSRATGVVGWLTAPRLYVPPAYPVVRIVNLSASSQTCVVNLFCSIETDVIPIPD